MKIFIGGSKAVNTLDENIKEKLHEIIKNKYDVLIGDCSGVDTAVQRFFCDNDYRNVTVYASGNVTRNNVGNFKVHYIKTDKKGFEFYRQKDVAMAKDADCGFMIWNGKSRGTLHNMFDLALQNKTCEIYFTESKRTKCIKISDL